MKGKILIFLFSCSVMLFAGQGVNSAVIYDNGPLVTHPAVGYGGADASAMQTVLDLYAYGFAHDVYYGYRLADDFTVTGLDSWHINNIVFFAYQTGSATASTITSVNYRIWDGVPGQPGSNIIFGDTTTNKLLSSEWSGMYRVLDTDLLNSARPIMKDTVNAGVSLKPGVYWLDWQTDGILSSGPWVPPISILGQTITGNALQFYSDYMAHSQSLSSGAHVADLAKDTIDTYKSDTVALSGWFPLKDVESPQGLPFILNGYTVPYVKLFKCDIDNNGVDEIIKIDANGNISFLLGLIDWYQIPGSLSEIYCGDINLDYKTDFVGRTNDGSVYYSIDVGNAWNKVVQARKNNIIAVNLDGALTWNPLAGYFAKLGLSDLNGNGTSEIYGLNNAGSIYVNYNLAGWQNIPGILADIKSANFNLSRNGNEFVGLNSIGEIYYSSDLAGWTKIAGYLSMLATGDINGDGKADIIGIGGSGMVYCSTNLVNWHLIIKALDFIATGDLNDDGKSDIIGFTATNDVYYTTDLINWQNIPGKAANLITGDFNGDGKDDVAIIGTDGKIYYTTNLVLWTLVN